MHQTKARLFLRLLNSPDHAKFIEVATSTLGAKGLLESDHNVADVFAVPKRAEDHVGKTGNKRKRQYTATNQTKKNRIKAEINNNQQTPLLLGF